MTEAQSVGDIDRAELRREIRKEYTEVARQPDRGFHFHTGRRLAHIVEYQDEWLEGIPESVVARFAGTGNPFSIQPLAPGERVIDLGCGAGIDSFIAAKQVGPDGAVVGVDMTPEMLDQARSAKAETGIEQVEFKEGYLEQIPIEDGWADVVISNGVVNLSPDKQSAFREIHRVIKPGGRIQIADILVSRPVSESAKQKIDLWTGWIAGALLDAELQGIVEGAGFEDFAITWRKPVFDGAPQSSSAAAFGTVGINYRASKPR